MRLFYQLTEQEQQDVVHHCASIVMDDMIQDGIQLEPVTQEDFQLRDRLEAAVNHLKDLVSKEEKIDYLMSDAFVSKAIYDIGLEMAKGAFYHDDEEMVIYPSSLRSEEKALPEISDTFIKQKKIPPHSLN